jgi:tRNA A37 threonylcarbamoyladenosine synthetase subunit TsaC/SUA5/YrdC
MCIRDRGRTPGLIPSTVVDCAAEDVKILREGAISKEEIEKVLK